MSSYYVNESKYCVDMLPHLDIVYIHQTLSWNLTTALENGLERKKMIYNSCNDLERYVSVCN